MHQPQCQNGTDLLLQGGYPLWQWKIICGEGRLSSTVCLPLPCGGGWRGSFSSSVCLYLGWSGGRRGGAHLHYPWSVSLYLEWRWGSGSFEPFTMSLPLPGMEVGEGLIYMSECLPLPWVEVGGGGGGLICIIHRVSPST